MTHFYFCVENDDEGESTISSTRSESVAVNVWPDLLSSFEIVRNKMESGQFDKGKPAMVARFGKILFHRYVIFPLINLLLCLFVLLA